MLANPQTMLAIYTIYVYLVFGHYFSCCSLVMIIPICRYSRGNWHPSRTCSIIGSSRWPIPGLWRPSDEKDNDHENSRRQSHPHRRSDMYLDVWYLESTMGNAPSINGECPRSYCGCCANALEYLGQLPILWSQWWTIHFHDEEKHPIAHCT